MKKLHNRLRQASQWYDEWHEGRSHRIVHWSALFLVLAFFGMLFTGIIERPDGLRGLYSKASGFPGGFLESYDSTASRPQYTAAEIAQFVPATKGPFTFPAPYNTQAIRLTDSSDCSSEIPDCINYVGYSYWRNMNNHVGGDLMYIILGKMIRFEGYTTPTVNLYSYNKRTDQINDLGNVFAGSSLPQYGYAEGLYFSAQMPTKLYTSGSTVSPRLYRYDILSKQSQTVFDVSTQPGWSDKFIFQYHSSDDDRVHSATLKQQETYAALGCVVYREDNQQFLFYPKRLNFDECQIDRSGRYLVIKDKHYSTTNELDAIVVDIVTGREVVLRDQEGAPGHSDNGFGYVVGDDNYSGYCGNDFCNPSFNGPVTKLWRFADMFSSDPAISNAAKRGVVVEQGMWNVGSATSHVTHTNARSAIDPANQFSCKSGTGGSGNRANEIYCYKGDGSRTNLIVAPVLTNLPSGSSDLYLRAPKGNLDVTGSYFIWTSNMGVNSNHLDAFLVKVPSQLLMEGPPPTVDTAPPTVSVTSPAGGATVTGTINLSANASDNVRVTKVDFFAGTTLIGSVLSSPYSVSFDTTAVPNGNLSITAKAYDAAGNVGTSTGVAVNVNNTTTPPPSNTARITITPDNLAFAAKTGSGAPAAKTVTIANTGTAFASVNISTDKDWCTISSEVMNLQPGQSYTAQVGVSAPSNVGVYYCTITLSSSAAENTPVTATVSYTVTTDGTTPPDTTAPIVSLTSPASGTPVLRKSIVAMAAQAADDSTITKVTFHVNGNIACTDTEAPYSCNWRVPNSRNGVYNLEARAYDSAGNIGRSQQVRVTAQ